MEEKPLSEYMEEEAARLDAEEKPGNDADTIDEIEEYLIEQGQWLEGQMAAEAAYKNCPLCAVMPDVFATLAGAVKDSLELSDDLRDKGVKDDIIAALLLRDRAWYECSKNIALGLFEAGHNPRNVINAHPELRSLAHHKKASRAKNSKRKQKRRASRNARRRQH